LNSENLLHPSNNYSPNATTLLSVSKKKNSSIDAIK
jgi:hypothetical protein